MRTFSEKLVICLFVLLFYLESFITALCSSMLVKTLLFKSYVICLYDAALWSSFKTNLIGKLRLCYHKCIKLFFGYKLCDRVTDTLFLTMLPSFSTVINNCKCM